jgi:hypothetical protein
MNSEDCPGYLYDAWLRYVKKYKPSNQKPFTNKAKEALAELIAESLNMVIESLDDEV